MTPNEYLKIERKQRRLIENAEAKIEAARRLADECRPPIEQLRPATASDIKEGLIVWHDNGDEGWFWHVICEPLHYGSDFKAYVADDGCRYGLRGAHVYI